MCVLHIACTIGMRVLRQSQATVAAPPFHQVPGVDPADEEDVERVGKACEWRHPRTASVRLLWDGRVTDAVLELLRTTRVGRIGTEILPSEKEEGEGSEREEGGPAPP